MPAEIQAAINYLADPPSSDPSRWLQYYINDRSRSNMRSEPHIVTIRDARSINDRLELDREGFKLATHRTTVRNYLDADDMARQPRELEALVRELSGATMTFCVGPQLRFGEGAPDGHRGLKVSRGVDSRPAGFAHGDFTAESIHWMADQWQGVRLADHRRFACYNVWRAITAPPQDMPLALCDAQSIEAGDRVDAMAVLDPPELHPQVVRIITTAFKPNSKHRWYYFSDMTSSEVVIFKTFDSDANRASNIAHSAFRDPSCPPGTPPRSSAEARILAVFD